MRRRRITCLPDFQSSRRTVFFFFNNPATNEIYTLSLHDALPISKCPAASLFAMRLVLSIQISAPSSGAEIRSEEHTSELQSLRHLVCRLLLEKKNNDRRLAALDLAIDREIDVSVGKHVKLMRTWL